MILSLIKGRCFIQARTEKMGNLSKSKIKLYICDKLHSCAQFAPWGKCAPGAYLPHQICTTWKSGANSHPDANLLPRCFFIKHHLHDQNKPQVQVYTTGVYLHWGSNCAYKRGLRKRNLENDHWSHYTFKNASNLSLVDMHNIHPCANILFYLFLYVQSTIFQLYRDGSSWVEPVLS